MTKQEILWRSQSYTSDCVSSDHRGAVVAHGGRDGSFSA